MSSNDIDKLSYTVDNQSGNIPQIYPQQQPQQMQQQIHPNNNVNLVSLKPNVSGSSNVEPSLKSKDNNNNNQKENDIEYHSDEESLGSDLDDEEDEELVTDHYLMCLFESVKKTKKKKRPIFRDGILHVNGREYAFKECQAEYIIR